MNPSPRMTRYLSLRYTLAALIITGAIPGTVGLWANGAATIATGYVLVTKYRGRHRPAADVAPSAYQRHAARYLRLRWVLAAQAITLALPAPASAIVGMLTIVAGTLTFGRAVRRFRANARRRASRRRAVYIDKTGA